MALGVNLFNFVPLCTTTEMILSLSKSIPLYSALDSRLSSNFKNSDVDLCGYLPAQKPSWILDLWATSLLYLRYGTAIFLIKTSSRNSLAFSMLLLFIAIAISRECLCEIDLSLIAALTCLDFSYFCTV